MGFALIPIDGITISKFLCELSEATFFRIKEIVRLNRIIPD
jgi:hypothetical protein